ncbi:MAG: LysR family transcriptional regulator [Polyangiaceae bacterium]|nr:LysR family transcriptional regulator [Polyangiaceae bacterium]
MPSGLLDDLPGLLCFARVVESGSFTKAAQMLGISKSVVSTRIASLEARLGDELLLRTTRRVTVTTAGARVYTHAREMAAAASAATSGATDAGRGLIRVSAPVSLSQMFLANPISELLSKNTGLRVDLVLNDRLVDLVEERIDLAIRVSKLADSTLVARRLAVTPMDVCGAPAYFAKHGRPTRPEELVRHNCLRYTLLRAEHEWRFYGSEGRIALDVGGNFETSNGTMLREAAIAGIGLVMLPRFMTFDALRTGSLETVLGDFAPRPLGIYAVRRGGRTAPRGVAELVRVLEKTLRAEPWARAAG